VAYSTPRGCIVVLEAIAIKHKNDHFIRNVEECLKYSLYHVFDPSDPTRILQKTDDWNFFNNNLEELLLQEQEQEIEESSLNNSKSEINIHEKETVKNYKIDNNPKNISPHLLAKNAALLKYKNRERKVTNPSLVNQSQRKIISFKVRQD
jgi:hypothetical protein